MNKNTLRAWLNVQISKTMAEASKSKQDVSIFSKYGQMKAYHKALDELEKANSFRFSKNDIRELRERGISEVVF